MTTRSKDDSASSHNAATSPPQADASLGAKWVEQVVPLFRLVILVVVLLFLASRWSLLEAILRSITHLEGFGVKIDLAERELSRLYSTPDEMPKDPNNKTELGNREAILAALVHAQRVKPAIEGATLLWVDPQPQNNRRERQVLESLGVHITIAISNNEALNLVEAHDFAPDLVISHVGVPMGNPILPLKVCPGIYSDQPQWAKGEHLDTLNAQLSANPPDGMELAERLANARKREYGDHHRPRIIFYTGSSGGRGVNICSRVITNYTDVLLENVVGALAQLRWQTLIPPKAK